MSLPKIDMPTFEVEIPSTKKTVKMRPMRVKEEKILLMAKEGNDPTEILNSVKQVVQSCIVYQVDGKAKWEGKDADIAAAVLVDDMALFDMEYLFLKLRAHSVSEKADVAYIDNDEVATAMEKFDSTSTEAALDYEKKRAEALEIAQRKATRKFTIDLNKVEVKFPEGADKNIKVSDKVGLVLKYPPASLYSDKEFLNSSGQDLTDRLVSKCIETVYDGKTVTDASKLSPEEVNKFVDTLDIKSYDKIKEFFQNTPHLYYKIEYTNKNGKERTIELTNLSDFFQL